MTISINRRNFFKLIGVGTASTLLAATGYNTTALAAQNSAPAIPLHEFSTQRDGKMNGRVLVTYATRSGSTSEVANRIAETIASRRMEVDLLEVKHVKDLKGYRMVVIGSGVYMGKWFGEASDFIRKNQQTLARMPLALFTVCLTMMEDTPQNRAEVLKYTAAQRELVKPFAEAWFAGKMEVEKLSIPYRWFMQMAKTKDGDYRNWDEIQAWAASLSN